MSAEGTLVGGKYRLKLRLGAGGMGEVWSATNELTDRQVALKLLAREVAEREPDAKQRFMNEAKVSARVDHPNIVDVIDVGQADDGQLFLVMELLTGVSLETALRRQTPPMTQRELAIVMLDVAGALEAAHTAGVVHRDLKPSNIFLHKEKDRVIPTVLDFGVSKFLWRKDDEAAQTITLAGTVLGSPLYMSPEQARGESEIDGRTDIFAFGGILFEALTGTRAYDAQNFNALIVKIATSKPKSIDDYNATVPESLRKVVRACLEPDPQKRAQNFGDVVYLIRAALPELGVNGKRLPAAKTPSALIDADATNALPVFEPAKTERMDRHSSVPSDRGGFKPAPSLGYEALRASQPPPSAPRSNPVPDSRASRPPPALTSGPHPKPPPERTASPVIVIVIAACAILAIGIASLARSTPSFVAPPPPIATNGELAIAGEPNCAVTVDASDRGSTPVTIELTPGDHKITCRPSTGPVRSAVVTVRAGSMSRYRFVFGP